MNYSRRIARALFGLLLFGTGSCCNIQANVGSPLGKPSAWAWEPGWG